MRRRRRGVRSGGRQYCGRGRRFCGRGDRKRSSVHRGRVGCLVGDRHIRACGDQLHDNGRQAFRRAGCHNGCGAGGIKRHPDGEDQRGAADLLHLLDGLSFQLQPDAGTDGRLRGSGGNGFRLAGCVAECEKRRVFGAVRRDAADLCA